MEELLAEMVKIQQQQYNLIEIVPKKTENSPSSFTP